MKREQIRVNRIGWATFLQQPERRKKEGYLQSLTVPEERCCLGHGCVFMGLIPEVHEDSIQYEGRTLFAPTSFKEYVGMNSISGASYMGEYLKGTEVKSLVVLNDETGTTPQQMGKLMEDHWIEGGPGTPFIPLTDYEE